MVCQYGMSEMVGRVYYNLKDINKLSPQLQNVINKEVRRLLDESYFRAKSLILLHEKEWKLLANALLDNETLSGEEIKEAINYQPGQKIEPKDFVLSGGKKEKNVKSISLGRTG
eukprot:UN03874